MRRIAAFALVSSLILTACGGKTPPETPAPQPAPAPASTPAAAPPSAPPAAAPKNDDGMAAAAEITRRMLADLSTVIHFDLDKSDVASSEAGILDRKAAILAANTGAAIKIAGNADERGSDEYNLALGMRRAVSAKRYLENKGVDGSRMETVSFGEEKPIDPAKSEDAFAKNRRDDFDVTRGGDRLVAPK